MTLNYERVKMKIEELLPSWVNPTLQFLNEPGVWYIYTLPMILSMSYFIFILLRQKQDFKKDNYIIQYFDTYWDVTIAFILSIIPIVNWFIVICIVNSFLNKRV